MLHPNPYGIPSHAYNGLLGTLNTKGGLAFFLQSCKETFLYTYFSMGHMMGKVSYSFANYSDGELDVQNPIFLISISRGTTRDKKDIMLSKVDEFLSMFSEACGFPNSIDVEELEGASYVVIKPDIWFMRSPVIAHTMLTFARMPIVSQNTWTHDATSIESFLEDIKKNPKKSNDENQLLKAEKNGNLTGILRGTLKCLNRYGFDDWWVVANKNGPNSGIRLGFTAAYQEKNDKGYISNISDYAGAWGTNSGNGIVPPGDKYKGWFG